MPTDHSTSCIVVWTRTWTCVSCIHLLCCDSKLQLLFTPSPLASAGRKPAQRVHACVCPRCTCVCGREERTSSLIHIILNRIFPSRVLLPATEFPKPSSGFPLQQKAGCLFWSIIVPEVLKPWVSTTVAPCAHLPRLTQLLNDCFYVT